MQERRTIAQPQHFLFCRSHDYTVMLASAPNFDRRALLALAESLHPGASEPAVFARWLKRSPIRPSRFFPMMEVELRHASRAPGAVRPE